MGSHLGGKRVIELDLVEEYLYKGEKRYRFKLKNTNVIINVRAETAEEGAEKAIEVLKKLGYIGGPRERT